MKPSLDVGAQREPANEGLEIEEEILGEGPIDEAVGGGEVVEEPIVVGEQVVLGIGCAQPINKMVFVKSDASFLFFLA